METARKGKLRSRQVAAIPIRRNARGQLQVLLVTSRETQRWVIPKGWPWPGRPNHEAAAEEAWEEAGVRGRARGRTIGSFRYGKRRNGGVLPVRVMVYLLEVSEVARSWPEIAERRRAWFSPDKAADAVEELELKALLRALELDALMEILAVPFAALACGLAVLRKMLAKEHCGKP